jgi:hypothetical protein
MASLRSESKGARKHCKHGNRRDLGLCPDCANEAMYKRQRAVDRAAFNARLLRIRGVA